MEQQANPNKKLVIKAGDREYARYPIKTRLITPEDKDFVGVVKSYVQEKVQPGDIVFISEKVIAIMQGRAYPLDEIKYSKIAAWLSRRVYKNPGGIGLASPQTMQLAIDEVGLWRILLAAAAAVLTKPLGIRGVFYLVAGDQARGIDGAVSYAIPPYNAYVSKAPRQPAKAAQKISEAIGAAAAIIDANDFGIRVLGASAGVDKKLVAAALKDNPLGQTDESTPIGILRKL